MVLVGRIQCDLQPEACVLCLLTVMHLGWYLSELVDDDRPTETALVPILPIDESSARDAPGNNDLNKWQLQNESSRTKTKEFARSLPGERLIIMMVVLQPQARMLGQIEKLGGRAHEMNQLFNSMTLGRVDSRLQDSLTFFFVCEPTGPSSYKLERCLKSALVSHPGVLNFIHFFVGSCRTALMTHPIALVFWWGGGTARSSVRCFAYSSVRVSSRVEFCSLRTAICAPQNLRAC